MQSQTRMATQSSWRVGRLRRAGRMSRRLAFAVCDQAIFSGSTFLFTVLLTRWMTPAAFGAYSVAYVVWILFQNIFEGLVSEPFSIFGAGRLARQIDAYTGRTLIGLVGMGLIFTGAIIAIAFVAYESGRTELANAFMGAGVAVTFLLIRLFIRQPLYIASRVHWAVTSGAIYFVGTLTALWLLRNWALLTPFTVFAAMVIGSLLASGIVIFVVLRPTWRSSDAEIAPRKLITEHIAYGKWAVGERMLMWLQGGILILELPAVAGLHASAAYTAARTLLMPALMTMGAVWSVLLPMLAREQASRANPFWFRFLAPGAVLVMSCYALMLICFGREIGHFLYAGRYDADLTLGLRATMAIGLVLAGLTGALELKLRSTLRVRQILMARVTAVAVLLVVGVALTAWLHLLGAAIATASGALTTAAMEYNQMARGARRQVGAKPVRRSSEEVISRAARPD